MKLKVVVLLLGGLIFGVFLGWIVIWGGGQAATAAPQNQQESPARGLPLSDFQLISLNGSKLRLSDYRGKPVIVNFWATWCEPCKEEMPLLEQAYADSKGKIVVLGVNAMENQAAVSDYVQRIGVTFPILLDLTGSVEQEYYVRGYPTSFFVDANGVLQAQHIGQLDEGLLKDYLVKIGG